MSDSKRISLKDWREICTVAPELPSASVAKQYDTFQLVI